MDRFYKTSIEGLTKANLLELRDDITDYVTYLIHIRNVLVNELGRANTFAGNELLRRLGYNK